VERFFRPWFSGVFLENNLETSSRFFKFVFRMFALGNTALPEEGMGSIPRQLVRDLPLGMLRLSTRVESMNGLVVRLADQQTIEARAIVLRLS